MQSSTRLMMGLRCAPKRPQKNILGFLLDFDEYNPKNQTPLLSTEYNINSVICVKCVFINY